MIKPHPRLVPNVWDKQGDTFLFGQAHSEPIGGAYIPDSLPNTIPQPRDDATRLTILTILHSVHTEGPRTVPHTFSRSASHGAPHYNEPTGFLYGEKVRPNLSLFWTTSTPNDWPTPDVFSPRPRARNAGKKSGR
jgi:hypothetical protein